MQDETENARRARQAQLNHEGFQLTKELEHEMAIYDEYTERYGKVWDSQGLREFFTVIGFMAPYVVVREKATGKTGSLEFCHSPRFYFNWQEDK